MSLVDPHVTGERVQRPPNIRNSIYRRQTGLPFSPDINVVRQSDVACGKCSKI